MKSIFDNVIKAVIAAALIGIFALGCVIHSDLEKLQPTECGTCGAMVYDVWYTSGHDGKFIPICERCAETIDPISK